MAPPVYKNQQEPVKPAAPAEPVKPAAPAVVARSQTTAVSWSHGLNEIEAAASFNARVDKMAAQGYAYQGSIQISGNSLLLVFTRWV